MLANLTPIRRTIDIIDNMLQFGMLSPDKTYLVTFANGEKRIGKIDFDRRIDNFFVLIDESSSVAIDARHVRSIEETGSIDDYLDAPIQA